MTYNVFGGTLNLAQPTNQENLGKLVPERQNHSTSSRRHLEECGKQLMIRNTQRYLTAILEKDINR